MADPLTLLRQFNINKRDVSEKEDVIIFGEFSYPKNVKTNYMIYKAGEGATKDYYTLEALHFILKNVSIPHPIYVQKAAAAKVPVVNRVDRKALLAYLNGDTDTSASIDKSAPLELGASRAAPLKRPPEDISHREDDQAKKAKVEVEKESLILQEKNALAARFDAPQAKPLLAVDKGTDGSLSQAMSVETINAIKAKRFAKKRSTIRGVPEEEIDAVGLENRAFIEAEIDVTRDIISKERILSNRNNILQSTGRTFTNILSILQVKSREQVVKTVSSTTATTAEDSRAKTANKPYNRYQQETFNKMKETEEFKIDTMGGFATMNKKSPAPSHHKTPPHRPASQVARPIAAAKPPKNQKRESKTPIIIVPASLTALINLYNVREFLQDNRFITAQERMNQGHRKTPELMLQRKRDLIEINLLRGHTAPIAPSENQVVTIPYRLIDNVTHLERKDWDRVVAVFVAGPQWQFKGWPWLSADGSPVNIFTKMKAFHLKYDEGAIDKNVLKWDTTVLTVSRSKRHLDSVSALKFWEVLDKFIMKNKRHLRF